jgi:hypothetical protein
MGMKMRCKKYKFNTTYKLSLFYICNALRVFENVPISNASFLPFSYPFPTRHFRL